MTFSVFKAPHKRPDSNDHIPKADHNLTNRLASKVDNEGSGISKGINIEKMLISDLQDFYRGEEYGCCLVLTKDYNHCGDYLVCDRALDLSGFTFE